MLFYDVSIIHSLSTVNIQWLGHCFSEAKTSIGMGLQEKTLHMPLSVYKPVLYRINQYVL